MSNSVAGGTTIVGAGEFAPYESTLKPSEAYSAKGKKMASVAETSPFDENIAHTAGMVRIISTRTICII